MARHEERTGTTGLTAQNGTPPRGFLTADWSAAPVPYATLTNPQTLNLYATVSDNPESFADLDGNCFEPPGEYGGNVGLTGPGDFGNPPSLIQGVSGVSTSINDFADDYYFAQEEERKQREQAQQQPPDQGLANVAYNESGSLRADLNAKPGAPGSAEDGAYLCRCRCGQSV
jgi:hypothetical protein